MKVPSKGYCIDIYPGAKFVERNHARPETTYFMEATSEVESREVEFYGEKGIQYSWMARDINDGKTVNYLVTDYALQYAPMLFQTFEDSEEFWTAGYSPEAVI